jgi:hypothetical protein
MGEVGAVVRDNLARLLLQLERMRSFGVLIAVGDRGIWHYMAAKTSKRMITEGGAQKQCRVGSSVEGQAG